MNKPQKVHGIPFQIAGNWSEQSKRLKGIFLQSTDADTKSDSGKKNKLRASVKIRLINASEEVEDIIEKMQPGKN